MRVNVSVLPDLPAVRARAAAPRIGSLAKRARFHRVFEKGDGGRRLLRIFVTSITIARGNHRALPLSKSSAAAATRL